METPDFQKHPSTWSEDFIASNPLLAAVRDLVAEPYAFPGGYVKILVMDDGEILCPKCVTDNEDDILHSTAHRCADGWQAIGVAHAGNVEDHHQECAHCGAEMVIW